MTYADITGVPHADMYLFGMIILAAVVAVLTAAVVHHSPMGHRPGDPRRDRMRGARDPRRRVRNADNSAQRAVGCDRRRCSGSGAAQQGASDER
jgi:hypothetical protein